MSWTWDWGTTDKHDALGNERGVIDEIIHNYQLHSKPKVK